MTPDLSREDQWIAIQHRTFVNWANEQLIHSNRSVENLGIDLCDGVKLVALVESLQFKKIGKVYSKPASRIQMLQNVSLALQAIEEDNVRLVNIGTDDIVGGNLKLILGLLWHLIIRYQISSSKAKAPPKKLMLSWFQNALPSLSITNFTSAWSDGIALNALLEYCKPGLCPNWRKLSSKTSLHNCRQAMQLAKEHLGVPRVISAEDFTSGDLDELSAMTYMSYFIRKNSAGYYGTLNWVCKQLKTTNISNFTTDWNDGYFLCALVHSFGGDIKGWPNLDRKNHQATCQLGIDGARKLGVEPMLTAAELSDPKVDHLTVMAYVSKFQQITPKRSKADRLTLDCYLLGVKVGTTTTFRLIPNDPDVEQSKVITWVSGPTTNPLCHLTWNKRTATCSFETFEIGPHELHVEYDGENIKNCPVPFDVELDVAKVKVDSDTSPWRLGTPYVIQISSPKELCDSVEVRLISPTGDLQLLETEPTTAGLKTSFRPSSVGVWKYQVHVGSQEVHAAEVNIYDPSKAYLSGPSNGVVGEEINLDVNIRDCGDDDLEAEVEYGAGRKMEDVLVTITGELRHVTFTPRVDGIYKVSAFIRGEAVSGSPKTVDVVDPGQILVAGEGLSRATRGVEAYFLVNTNGMQGNITAAVEVSGQRVPVVKEPRAKHEFEFRYIPVKVGTYTVNVLWEDKPVAGSPFSAYVTDKSNVILIDDLREMKDENDRLALEYGRPSRLNFDVSKAGPGTFKAEVLSPDGKLPVDVNQTSQKATVTFTAYSTGDHDIHLYWSDAPIEYSPLLAYCPGPPLPVDASKVVIKGPGAERARATVPAEFIIDGQNAGPGVPRVVLKGIQMELPVEVKALKYDRYKCTYTSSFPGSFLLYIYWSDTLLNGCPLKINVTAKGDVTKVRVTGEGLRGGISGQEVKIFVDTVEAGPGEITAECHSHRQNARCDIKENSEGQFTIRVLPTTPEKHVLQVRYDGQHVKGSPFILRVGEPPDPTRVRVFGPGIEDGLIDTFESRFLVDTHGAGAGQLAVKIRGPRGGFRVDMHRESQAERTIVCRYDPREPGEYAIHVRWSGVHVPGSPFMVQIADGMDDLNRLTEERGFVPREELLNWKGEI